MFTYSNESDKPLTIINLGVVAPGKTISSPEPLNHPDLTPVPEKEPAKQK